jgi:hypothetical protein
MQPIGRFDAGAERTRVKAMSPEERMQWHSEALDKMQKNLELIAQDFELIANMFWPQPKEKK